MSRHARIIRTIRDAYGDRWDVREERETAHGFTLAIGWPHGFARGRGGCGGPRVILTSSLVRYLEGRRTERGVDLPIARTTVKRLWRLLGRDYYGELAAKWEAMAGDLASLTLEEFAAKHQTTTGAAEMWRLRLFGKRLREPGWWQEEPARSLLAGALPRAYVAEKLDISIGAVGRLRWQLRREETI